MKEPAVFPRPLDRSDIRGFFNDANKRCVTAGVAADRADLLFREIEAARAGAHPLAQGVLSGETYAEADDACTGAAIDPSDIAPFKVNAEVLVVGSCFAPGGKPAAEIPAVDFNQAFT